MKVFVTGVGGQLGHDVVNELRKCGIDCIGSDIIEKSDDYPVLHCENETAIWRAGHFGYVERKAK